MGKPAFHAEGWDDLMRWVENDRRTARKVRKLIEEALRDPFGGTGNPEPLKHLGPNRCSRRITGEHRLVHVVADEETTVLGARGRY
ncbi:Txe/YoeB family addiction module toxin [Nocardiopsis akebiae]|uniref:Endoribonuclease YoeB n=1 Tax=Nocardiopsis akebiae TaxID=2831968 RepID=A0ABX8C6R7_9ACTN|nr:Txe/YoeB family addiction module toxin [Nocardiopsis akebiae]QUX30121.1 Txe/YoeB family addiction module toxin [Nocardiopsis akebiae]